MTASAKPNFGFEGLSDFKPSVPAPNEPARADDIDRVGDRLGFASREAPVRRRRRQMADEPTDQINIRAGLVDINRFVEWCEQHRYSYREGFSELVKLIR